MKERFISKREKELLDEEDDILAKSKRKAERLDEENEIKITILSEITNFPKEKIVYKYSQDVSMTGTRIQGNVLLPIDTFLKINLTLKNSKQNVVVFGKVKWSKPYPMRGYFESGVEFVDTPRESIKKLENYILSINQYKSLSPVGVPYWIFEKFNKPKS